MNSDNSNNNNNTNNNNDNNINDNNDNDVDLKQFYIELNKKHKELDKRIRKARNQRANKTLVKKQKTDVIQKTKYEEKKKSQKERYHRLKSYVAYLRRLDDLNDDQKEILRTYDRVMDLKKSRAKESYEKKKSAREPSEESTNQSDSVNFDNENTNTQIENNYENAGSNNTFQDEEQKEMDENNANQTESREREVISLLESSSSDEVSVESLNFENENGHDLKLRRRVVEKFTTEQLTEFLSRIQPLLNASDQYEIILINESSEMEQFHYIEQTLGLRDMDDNDILNLSRIEEIKKRCQMKNKVYKKFEHFRWKTKMSEERFRNYKCPICMQSTEDLDNDKERKMTILTCPGKHVQCYKCLRSMAEFQSFCPECKHALI